MTRIQTSTILSDAILETASGGGLTSALIMGGTGAVWGGGTGGIIGGPVGGVVGGVLGGVGGFVGGLFVSDSKSAGKSGGTRSRRILQI